MSLHLKSVFLCLIFNFINKTISMKRILTLLFIFSYSLSCLAQRTYCIPLYESNCKVITDAPFFDAPISIYGFELKSIKIDPTNSTQVITQVIINNPNNGCRGAVSDHTSIVGNVTKGETYTFGAKLAQATNGIYFYAYIGVWIDYNDDGDFDDLGETVFLDRDGSPATYEPLIHTGSFTIPNNVSTGNKRLRVRRVGNPYGNTTSPACARFSDGEAEDYTLNISPSSVITNSNVAVFNGTSNEIVSAEDLSDISNAGSSSSLNLRSFTMETWVKFNNPAVGTTDWIAEIGTTTYGVNSWFWFNNANQFGLGYNKLIVGFSGANNGNNIVDFIYDFAPVPGNWYHLAYTYDAASKKINLFIDGISKGEKTNIGASTPDFFPRPRLQLGRRIFGGAASHFLDGSLDEFRLWNYAKNQSDILREYKKELRGNEPNLVAYYKFDEPAAPAQDCSPKNLNAVTDATTRISATGSSLENVACNGLNDECSDATTLNISSTTTPNWIQGSLAKATVPSTNPEYYCNDGYVANDLWYKFTATDKRVLVSLRGTGAGRVVLNFYTSSNGDCTNLSYFACNNPTSDNISDYLMNAPLNTTIFMRVSSSGLTTPYKGSFELGLSTPPPPPKNDACSPDDLEVISKDCSKPTEGTTDWSTNDKLWSPNIPNNCKQLNDEQGRPYTIESYNGSVWYKFVAKNTNSSIKVFEVINYNTNYRDYNFNPLHIQVYSGCGDWQCVDAGVRFGLGGPSNKSVFTLPLSNLTINKTYYIRVQTWENTQSTKYKIFLDEPVTYTITGVVANYCKNAATVSLVGKGSPAGATFILKQGNTVISADATEINPSTLAVGSYSLIYTKCNYSSPITNFTISPQPTISATAIPSTICAGETTQLSASVGGGVTSGFTISWSNDLGNGGGKTTPALTTNTTYNVSVTTTAGCSANNSISVIVMPIVSITGLNTTYCKDGPAINLAGTPTGGAFTININTTPVTSLNTATVGTYIVKYSYANTNQCSSSASQTVTISDCSNNVWGGVKNTCTTIAGKLLTKSTLNNISDYNGLMAQIDPGEQSLTLTNSAIYVNSMSVRRTPDNIPYLDRNYTFNFEKQPTAPVLVRLYFTKMEYEALKKADPSIQTGDQLRISRISGGSSTNCSGILETTNGQTLTELTGVLHSSASGEEYYLEFQTDKFSNFFITGQRRVVETPVIVYINCPESKAISFNELNSDGSVPETTVTFPTNVTGNVTYKDQVFNIPCGSSSNFKPDEFPLDVYYNTVLASGADKVVVRRFTVVFSSALSSLCSQVLYIKSPDINTIKLPENTTATCLNGVTNINPNSTGYPQFGNGNNILDVTRGITSSYSDAPIINGILVRTWTVFDKCGNTKTFTQKITIPTCIVPQITISGEIKRETGESISAMVKVMNLKDSVKTMEGSFYSFPTLPMGESYRIRPERNADILNGVSTYDISLISKYILGLEVAKSPYQLIAMDVNRNGEVEAGDMLELRNLILRKITKFSNNTAWRFIPRSYVFKNPENPFAEDFPEILNFNKPTINVNNADFIAVKIGDGNLSARTSNLSALQVRNTPETAFLELPDGVLEQGKEYRIPVKSSIKSLVALQFALNIDKNAVTHFSIEKGDLAQFGESNINIMGEKGIVTTAWSSPKSGSNDNTVFTVVLKTNKPISIREIISLNSEIMDNFGYNTEGGEQHLQLRFASEKAANPVFELHQNRPNPFSQETTISFVLPETNSAHLTIFDINGREIYTMNQVFIKGYNEITVPKSLIKTTGVYFYRLQSEKSVAVKRMQYFND
jgi:hypothetical protein